MNSSSIMESSMISSASSMKTLYENSVQQGFSDFGIRISKKDVDDVFNK